MLDVAVDRFVVEVEIRTGFGRAIVHVTAKCTARAIQLRLVGTQWNSASIVVADAAVNAQEEPWA